MGRRGYRAGDWPRPSPRPRRRRGPAAVVAGGGRRAQLNALGARVAGCRGDRRGPGCLGPGLDPDAPGGGRPARRMVLRRHREPRRNSARWRSSPSSARLLPPRRSRSAWGSLRSESNGSVADPGEIEKELALGHSVDGGRLGEEATRLEPERERALCAVDRDPARQRDGHLDAPTRGEVLVHLRVHPVVGLLGVAADAVVPDNAGVFGRRRLAVMSSRSTLSAALTRLPSVGCVRPRLGRRRR